MRRWMAASLLFSAAVIALASSDATAVFAQDKKTSPPVAKVYPDPSPEQVKTADGVTLHGLFHRSTEPKAATNGDPVVVLLYPPGVGKDMTKGAWDSLANRLNDEGYHVFRFDWRGHGKSTDISDVKKFWQTSYSAATNIKYIRNGQKNPPKNNLLVGKDFATPGNLAAYFPMFVNDLAAVRTYLDQKNDEGVVNTSSVYLIGAGDAATLGMLWLTGEWHRPAIHPNLLGSDKYNVVPIPLFDPQNTNSNTTAAGETIAGAVWLSPSRPISGPINDAMVKKWVSTMAQQIRDSNPMLFLYGEKDTKGLQQAKFFFDNVLVAEPRGTSLKKLEQTFLRPITGVTLNGPALLGNNAELKTEDKIVEYLAALQKERSKVTRKQRQYTEPYLFNLGYFLGY